MQPRTTPQHSQIEPVRFRATAAAIAHIEKLQHKRRAEGKPTLGLRIGIRGGGCTGFSYLFEWEDHPPKSHDHVFPVSETAFIAIDPKSFVYLQGTELDYVTGLMGHGFRLSNPNAKGSCGCGDSVQF